MDKEKDKEASDAFLEEVDFLPDTDPLKEILCRLHDARKYLYAVPTTLVQTLLLECGQLILDLRKDLVNADDRADKAESRSAALDEYSRQLQDTFLHDKERIHLSAKLVERLDNRLKEANEKLAQARLEKEDFRQK